MLTRNEKQESKITKIKESNIIEEEIVIQKEQTNKNKINNFITNSNIKTNNNIKTRNRIIGKIVIPKININQNLYEINSSDNNINKNITILKGSKYPENNNTSLFLAAHSGGGPLAYFRNLNLLKEKDIIKINYKSINYIYVITEKYEIEKNGIINIPKENHNQLVLTTCSISNSKKQLVINAILKETY